MKKFLIGILACLHFAGMAQTKQKTSRGLHFSSINSIGLSTGSSGECLNLQTINGVRYQSWNFGIGTGIDWCGIKSIPLVADIRKTFSANRHKPFLYANGGISFLAGEAGDYYYSGSNYKSSYHNGFTGEGGLGYKLQLKNETSLLLSAGFQYLHQRYEQGYPYYIMIWPSPNLNLTRYDYYYRRVMIRLGISF